MRTWSITEARANISNVFDEALKSGPQRIERRDSESAMLVSEADWNRLASDLPRLRDLILNSPIEPDDLPQRRPARIVSEEEP